MIATSQDTHPLTTFRDNSAELIDQLRATHRPITLTVDGKPEIVIQEAAEYQRILDLAAANDANEGIRQGLADVAAGRTRPAREVFDEFREKRGIPR